MARVLIVDDAALARRIMRNALLAAGHEVAGEASTGSGAVREYEAHRPDLVMMDVTMPEMDGLEASKRILLVDSGARIVMVTSINREDVVRESLRSGASGYLVKPYNPEKLLRAVDRALTQDRGPTPNPAA